MSNRNGFTLIEAVVGVLIAAIVVIAMGGLSERLVHHRTTTDSNSAAMSLAERQMEQIRNDPLPDPNATQCAANPVPALCGDTSQTGLPHGPISMGANGGAGAFSVSWWVVDDSTLAGTPLVRPTGVSVKAKKITVTVTHNTNPAVNATIVTYFTPS